MMHPALHQGEEIHPGLTVGYPVQIFLAGEAGDRDGWPAEPRVPSLAKVNTSSAAFACLARCGARWVGGQPDETSPHRRKLRAFTCLPDSRLQPALLLYKPGP